MIVQRPSAMHSRDREIAAMPMARDETASPLFWIVGLIVMTALMGALLS